MGPLLTGNKLWLIGLTLILALLSWSRPALAGDSSQAASVTWEEGLDSLDLREMEKYKNEIDGELSAYLQKVSLKQWFIDFIQGKWELNVKEVLGNLLRFFLGEVAANAGLLGKLMVLSVVTSLLVNFQAAFGGEGTSRISYMAAFMALMAVGIASFRYALGLGQQTVTDMSDFMVSVLPQMTVLVAGMGGINTSTALFPLMMTACTACASAIQHVVFPLVVFSAVLHLVDTAADTVQVQKLGKLLSSAAIVGLGLFMTVFVGLLGLRTVYGAVLDEVTLKTTQFATSFFPVIGKLLSEALEYTLGYMAILKHALSIFGLVIVFGICIFPVLKIGAIVLIYKLSAALVEPLGDARTAQALDIMAKHLTLVLASVVAVALMFFIMITVLAGITNQPLLLK